MDNSLPDASAPSAIVCGWLPDGPTEVNICWRVSASLTGRSYLARSDGGENRVGPNESFAPETSSHESGDDPYVVAFQPKRIGDDISCANYPLRGFVYGEAVTLPNGQEADGSIGLWCSTGVL